MKPGTNTRRKLDKTDRRILHELHRDGRIANVALAKRVNLSASPCLERVRRLEREGFIRGYTAVLDPQRLDAALLVFVEISLNRTSGDAFKTFRKSIMRLPEVLDCHLVSGNFDYLIKARVKDMAEYRALLGEKLLSIPAVQGSRTYVVMEEIKESLSLPVLESRG